MMRIIIALTLGISLLSCNRSKEDIDNLTINNFQVIGSHNSYKQAIEDHLLLLISKEDSLLALALDYSHPSLEDQLDLGLRSLELDVFYDPEGGRYSDPLGNRLLSELNIQPAPFDIDEKLKTPGLKLFHSQDIDFRSHHLLFKDALRALKNWSERNPDHFPIIITIEPKDRDNERPGFVVPLPFSATALNSIDEEILEIIGDERLITPDLVRKSEPTLEISILKNGWPELKDVKGKFMFALDARGNKLDDYLSLSEGLRGRVMFVNVMEGNPEAAFRIINNPVRDKDYIIDLVKKGYMVRTRSDAGTSQARRNDYSLFLAAKESGAQIISTDYYVPNLKLSTFKIEFDDNSYLRINPVLNPSQP